LCNTLAMIDTGAKRIGTRSGMKIVKEFADLNKNKTTKTEIKIKPKFQKMEKITKLIAAVEILVPEYLSKPEDAAISGGGSAICIIDEDNYVFGKLFGSDKIRTRQCYKIAWIKASQAWITGYKTGEFEKLVYSGQIDEKKFGIIRPDYLGWEGGQPVTLKDGTRLSIGFSGFRGISDLEIVNRAILNAGL
jgi:hypothetical protein